MQQWKTTPKPLEEAIEVIIRIRPVPISEQEETRCVSLSDYEENTIVVETNNKKQLFSFDYIASEKCTQKELYQRLGQPVLEQTLKGYNSCIFSYGQTGAGKTYSILGQSGDLAQNPMCESRGIMPRLLEELFNKIKDPNSKFQQVSITCSYLEIYNEQIIDLLTKQSKNLTIRQDLRRGVFIDGLTEHSIESYEQVLAVITKGLTIRKTASTCMNSESSRSHTIFTMLLSIQFLEGQITKSFKSKLHIVDLAGSERIKLTKVEGERLKQGCSINKSLLTLSHVISSLVEFGKKKKHIPFRDSKLTFFLKDSFGGNSKTKLLANISPNASYIGDTISTLMFAKRAKIIKSKVEPNQNIADNFDNLRTQIRKLRQQLAQTKFIQAPGGKDEIPSKVISQSTELKDIFLPTESILQSHLSSDVSQKSNGFLKVFEQNQNAYRVIIESLLVQLKNQNKDVTVRSNYKTLFDQKKAFEKIVYNQQKLITNFPAFTKLFNQNIQNRRRVKDIQDELTQYEEQVQEKSTQIVNLKNTIEILNADIEHLNLEISESSKSKVNQRSRSNSTRRKRVLDTIVQENPFVPQMSLPPIPSFSPFMPVVESQNKKTYSSQRTSKKIPDLTLFAKNNRRFSMIVPQNKGSGFRNIVERQNNMIDEYESTIEQIKKNFLEIVSGMKAAYAGLEEMYEQQKRQKQQIRKRKRKQPEIQAVSNQNQYLKLNIMQLESEISRLEQQIFKKGVEVKTAKQENNNFLEKLKDLEKISSENGMKEAQLQSLIQKITFIKLQAEKANIQLNQQLNKQDLVIVDLQNKLVKQTKQNYALLSKNQILTQQTCSTKTKLNQEQSFISSKQLIESTSSQQSLYQDMIKDINRLTIQTQKLQCDIQQCERQKSEQATILEKAALKILNITKQMNTYKETSNDNAEQVRILVEKIQSLEREDKKYFEKTKILEVDLTRMRKQNQKNEYIVGEIGREFGCGVVQFIEQVKLMKLTNQNLIVQNQQLKVFINQTDKKTLLIKNSKSMNTLETMRDLVTASLGRGSPLPESKETRVQSHRQSDNPLKKRQTKKGLFSTFQQQKQKTSNQFKSYKPLTQQGLNRLKSPESNR